MTPDWLTVLGPMALVMVAALGWDFGRRWLISQESQRIERTRLDAFEADLAAHKATHERAIKNLVDEMREAIGEAKTRSSLALERAQTAARRFGR